MIKIFSFKIHYSQSFDIIVMFYPIFLLMLNKYNFGVDFPFNIYSIRPTYPLNGLTWFFSATLEAIFPCRGRSSSEINKTDKTWNNSTYRDGPFSLFAWVKFPGKIDFLQKKAHPLWRDTSWWKVFSDKQSLQEQRYIKHKNIQN